MVGAMLVYGALRLGDLWVRGHLGTAFSFSYESCLFLVEFGLGLVVPLVLMGSRRLRDSPRALYGVCLTAVLGFITHRMNVSMTGFENAQGGHYIPAQAEAVIALLILALAFAGFRLAVKYFNVFPAPVEETAGGRLVAAQGPPAPGGPAPRVGAPCEAATREPRDGPAPRAPADGARDPPRSLQRA
jgi:Ni/Fe-hydrogenase subunit HybB-like protein